MTEIRTLHLVVRIRPCEAEDLPSLERVGRPATYIRHGFAQHEAGEIMFLVAEVNDAAVGKIWIRFADPVPQITGLVVRPVFQDLGLARRLLRAAEDCVRERGFHRLRAIVGKTNREALRLYEQYGFRIVAGRRTRLEVLSATGEYAEREEAVWILEKIVA